MRRCFYTISLGLFFTGALPAQDFINQVLSDSPVGFWILNDPPGSPATAVDSSLSSFHGTYGLGVTPRGIAGPSWVPSPGQVADFTGGSIVFPTTLNLGVNGYTLEAWINPDVVSLTQSSRILAAGTGFDGYGFGTASGGRLQFTTFTQHDYFTTGVTVLPNQWQYVSVVLDTNNDAHFYVNGVFVQTVTGILPTDPPSGLFTIGNQSPGLGHTDEIFFGGLAGVSVYNTILTAGQILAQYNAAFAPIPEPSALLMTCLAAFAACCALKRRRRDVGWVDAAKPTTRLQRNPAY